MKSLPSILVSDTNIWIDLYYGGLQVDVFKLPYRIIIPDFARPELQAPSSQALEEMGLNFMELGPDLINELTHLSLRHRNLSIVDLSAFLLTRSLGAVLISGDKRLTDLARSEKLTVHGILWLLDQMVACELIYPAAAANALRKMLEHGTRLPDEECRKRLAIWE